jgi:uncharacterized membrane protein
MTATGYDHAREDHTLPTVVYALYLLGLINGLTVVIGLIVAYANRERAGPAMESHYIFQIRTFWIAIAWWVIACVLLVYGIALAPFLIGIPLLVAGGLIVAMTHIWFALRAILGLIHVSRGEAYPRPRSWLA